MKASHPSQSFCILPWMHVALNSTGYLRLCCNSTPGENILIDDTGKKLHVSHLTTIENMQNVQWLKNIRASMLKGEKISLCQRCYREEESGVRSAREGWNAKYNHHIDAALSQTLEDGKTLYFKPTYLDLRLGNLCNLKCRMCNPYASKKWLEDWNFINREQLLPEREIARLQSVKWFDDEKTWSTLSHLSELAEEIYFTGGEPFLIHQQVKLLHFLIAQGAAKNIRLKYNTNLTVLPKKVIDTWIHFKGVNINVSLDATEDLNSYIRHPANWTDIHNNLTLLNQLSKENNNIEVGIHTTVQVYNINRLQDIIDYLKSHDSIQQIPYFNILNHPSYLNIRVLPKAYKDKLSQQIEGWVNENESRYSKQQDQISLSKLRDLIKYMNAEHWDFLLPELKNYTFQLDQRRNESLSQSNPELYQNLSG